jgi:hypothetical protein
VERLDLSLSVFEETKWNGLHCGACYLDEGAGFWTGYDLLGWSQAFTIIESVKLYSDDSGTSIKDDIGCTSAIGYRT